MTSRRPFKRARLAVLLIPVLVMLVTGQSPVAHADSSAQAIPTTTPIKHFVTLMQENHSFDNYFGTYPGADGIPASVCMPYDLNDPSKGCVKPFRIGNRPVEDLGHSRSIFLSQFNRGKMNGFVSAYTGLGIRDPRLPMGHYDDRDIPYYWNLADNYVLFDRNFTSASAGSVANHMFWVAGQPGSKNGDIIPPDGFTVPTIFDRLQAAGVSWKFYVQNYDPSVTFRTPGKGDRGSQVVWCPLLAYARFLDDPELWSHIVPIEQYYTDLDNGTLPAVSYIVPSGSSEHPPGSIQAGEAFVKTLVNSLARSSAWSTSAFTWSYDDWGGWYDHVPPPKVDRYGYGFRAPALLISPYAPHGVVNHTTVDFTSQLKFIEENWGVAPLSTRDARATSLGEALDFDVPARPATFVNDQRMPVAPVTARRVVVYVSYASALATFLLVMLVAVAIASRHRRHRKVA